MFVEKSKLVYFNLKVVKVNSIQKHSSRIIQFKEALEMIDKL